MSAPALRLVSTLGPVVALLALATGCATAGPGAASDASATVRIAAVHRAKCSACHAPVDPGTRKREVIVAAMNRHKKRAKLSAKDVREMVDYLAPRSEASAKTVQEAP